MFPFPLRLATEGPERRALSARTPRETGAEAWETQAADPTLWRLGGRPTCSGGSPWWRTQVAVSAPSVLVTQTEAAFSSATSSLPSWPLGAWKWKAEGREPSCQQEVARWDRAPGEAAAESG